ncbi:MAG: AbrB/MazE/SpoVT family DNA-binding domain-containing protein [Candidatus Nanohaloarchaea archaeon]
MATSAGDGRVYIPKELREKYGEKFHVVDRGDRIVLVPVSGEPLEALRDEFSGVEGSVEELKDEALDAAVEEAGE